MANDDNDQFRLDKRLERDSVHVLWLGLCELRLIDDRRWPWLILVPQRPGVEEMHALTPLDQTMLTFETNLAAAALKEMTGCLKINTGALGNVVRQLHIHVIGRDEGDPNWPGPVWGFGERKPYAAGAREAMVRQIRSVIDETSARTEAGA